MRITTANVAMQLEVRSLTAERDCLNKRLAAARDNARFADKCIAVLEAQIAEQLIAPPSACRANLDRTLTAAPGRQLS